MSDGNDRFDSSGAFVMGLLTGAVVGAGIGMLFATKTGSELRNQLSDQASSLADQAANLADQAAKSMKKVSANASEWVDRGREVYGKAKDAAAKGADDAQAYARDKSNNAVSTVESASRRL
jgi:gas vesicle protein